MDIWTQEAARVRPTPRQLAWQETEFYAFVHFGPNTFTDRSWGRGDEDPAVFAPTALDARQWVGACQAAGMRGLILTCKHHDGFCLWPSRWTEHSVKNSPWRGGRGDLVREVSEACREEGLKFGIYLSPWDRHDSRYGDSPAYNQYFIRQLTELLTDYGPIFSVWLDGACGEGPNGKRQVYDWDAYYRTVRDLQPGAVLSVCGPDVRWCGNEAGSCRASEWSVVPKALQDIEKIEAKSQQVEGGEFSRRITSADEDLGSRAALRGAAPFVWYPAEVNTSIRPEWFYHPAEDGQVKSLADLLEIYYASVGGNAAFLLNIPPDRRGLFHENDVARLAELGQALKQTFGRDLTGEAMVMASESLDEAHGAAQAVCEKPECYWRPREGTQSATLTLRWDCPQAFDKVVLQEHIASSGQRIEAFTLEAEEEGTWRTLHTGTVVGYKAICRFPPVRATALRLAIRESRGYPTLKSFRVYCGI